MSDHIKKTDEALDGVHDWQAEEGQTDATMLTLALEAQTQATLALVEQQRIANLQVERTHLQNELARDHHNEPKLMRLMRVDGQIQDGLRLRERGL